MFLLYIFNSFRFDDDEADVVASGRGDGHGFNNLPSSFLQHMQPGPQQGCDGGS